MHGWQAVAVDVVVAICVTALGIYGKLPVEAAVAVLTSIVWAHAAGAGGRKRDGSNGLPPAAGAVGLVLAGLTPRKP